MSDELKNKLEDLSEAEAKNVTGGMWIDRVRSDQPQSDGTSITPPAPITGIKLNMTPTPGIQLWESTGTPDNDGIYIKPDPLDGEN